MSAYPGGILGHPCVCGHPATGPWHRTVPDASQRSGTVLGPCRALSCRCLTARPEGPSVVIPAYDSDGNRLEYVIGPDEQAGEMRSCACGSCRELWLTCRPRPDADVDDLFGEVGA